MVTPNQLLEEVANRTWIKVIKLSLHSTIIVAFNYPTTVATTYP